MGENDPFSTDIKLHFKYPTPPSGCELYFICHLSVYSTAGTILLGNPNLGLKSPVMIFFNLLVYFIYQYFQKKFRGHFINFGILGN